MCNISDTLCCYSSYHPLLELHHTMNGTRMLLPRGRHREKGCLCGRWNGILMQISFWMSTPGGRLVAPNSLTSYRQCLYMWRQQGRKEYEWAICRGCWQSYLELDTEVKVPAIQLIGFKTTRDEIWGLYNEVNQLKRSLGPYCVAQRRQRSWPR